MGEVGGRGEGMMCGNFYLLILEAKLHFPYFFDFAFFFFFSFLVGGFHFFSKIILM